MLDAADCFARQTEYFFQRSRLMSCCRCYFAAVYCICHCAIDAADMLRYA